MGQGAKVLVTQDARFDLSIYQWDDQVFSNLLTEKNPINSDQAMGISQFLRQEIAKFDQRIIAVAQIEKMIDGKAFPSLLVIRKANEKSLMDIHNEIRAAQYPEKKDMTTSISTKKIKQLYALPKFVRKLIFWERLRKNPFYLKKLNGTVQLNPLGMFAKGLYGWAINLGHHPLIIIIGGISEQPRIIDGNLENFPKFQL